MTLPIMYALVNTTDDCVVYDTRNGQIAIFDNLQNATVALTNNGASNLTLEVQSVNIRITDTRETTTENENANDN